MRHDFCDGKYTVINDNGILSALRHGKPWGRDLVGDNLVYWMLVEVDRLKTQNAELLEALRGLEPYLDAIVCYASTMDEYEPNRLAVQARAAIAKATDSPKEQQ